MKRWSMKCNLMVMFEDEFLKLKELDLACFVKSLGNNIPFFKINSAIFLICTKTWINWSGKKT